MSRQPQLPRTGREAVEGYKAVKKAVLNKIPPYSFEDQALVPLSQQIKNENELAKFKALFSAIAFAQSKEAESSDINAAFALLFDAIFTQSYSKEFYKHLRDYLSFPTQTNEPRQDLKEWFSNLVLESDKALASHMNATATAFRDPETEICHQLIDKRKETAGKIDALPTFQAISTFYDRMNHDLQTRLNSLRRAIKDQKTGLVRKEATFFTKEITTKSFLEESAKISESAVLTTIEDPFGSDKEIKTPLAQMNQRLAAAISQGLAQYRIFHRFDWKIEAGKRGKSKESLSAEEREEILVEFDSAHQGHALWRDLMKNMNENPHALYYDKLYEAFHAPYGNGPRSARALVLQKLESQEYLSSKHETFKPALAEQWLNRQFKRFFSRNTDDLDQLPLFKLQKEVDKLKQELQKRKRAINTDRQQKEGLVDGYVTNLQQAKEEHNQLVQEIDANNRYIEKIQALQSQETDCSLSDALALIKTCTDLVSEQLHSSQEIVEVFQRALKDFVESIEKGLISELTGCITLLQGKERIEPVEKKKALAILGKIKLWKEQYPKTKFLNEFDKNCSALIALIYQKLINELKYYDDAVKENLSFQNLVELEAASNNLRDWHKLACEFIKKHDKAETALSDAKMQLQLSLPEYFVRTIQPQIDKKREVLLRQANFARRIAETPSKKQNGGKIQPILNTAAEGFENFAEKLLSVNGKNISSTDQFRQKIDGLQKIEERIANFCDKNANICDKNANNSEKKEGGWAFLAGLFRLIGSIFKRQSNHDHLAQKTKTCLDDTSKDFGLIASLPKESWTENCYTFMSRRPHRKNEASEKQTVAPVSFSRGAGTTA